MLKIYIVTLLLILAITNNGNAQLSTEKKQKIDSLFSDWSVLNHPGGAVAIMIEDSLVFSKAYGLASLEYLVPNSTETIFNLASVSKQFTAMGIVKLEEQGKLSIDDDIRLYIPEFPDFGKTITIRHLLHHTSGLRSFHYLLVLAGWRINDERTNEDLYRFMLKQKELNFNPGDEYMYSNTGYILMVNIIEEVTGEPFVSWMKSNVFDALGMYNTYIETTSNAVHLNTATSYSGDESFQRNIEYWSYYGSANINSTTSDLLVWLRNFYTPTQGWESEFELMQTLDRLNDGGYNNYAFGVEIDTYKGIKRIQHGGSTGGFRTFIGTLPSEKTSIVVLSNFSTSNPPDKWKKVADIIFSEKNEPTKEINFKPINLSANKLNQYVGYYWEDKQKLNRKITLKNDTLWYGTRPMAPISEDTFLIDQQTGLKVNFNLQEGSVQMIVSGEGSSPYQFDKYEYTTVTNEELKEYVGTYYSSEIETSYTIYLKNGSLICYHPRHGEIKMERIAQDKITAELPIVFAQIIRSSDGEVNGLRVSNGRVRNMWFEKQE
ncbi:CubicO group peptidase, beta-lactamase class C family [Algoriphagus faecimaris]|uniref:CubicO group peptidase, beta-lactamase class C family n=1 Tax=Algoriphagus faecimaris TaxID=686796 RepID=A0A1G6Q8P9_9BACT|nr:serine hydrolase domain-containing protein [Algoriphagus faecimaris]SDC88274.1 CubicO group peptidase, beta-lactamase class C family [Algoriphagus faecimaris]